jgi:hypothetical protein
MTHIRGSEARNWILSGAQNPQSAATGSSHRLAADQYANILPLAKATIQRKVICADWAAGEIDHAKLAHCGIVHPVGRCDGRLVEFSAAANRFFPKD